MARLAAGTAAGCVGHAQAALAERLLPGAPVGDVHARQVRTTAAESQDMQLRMNAASEETQKFIKFEKFPNSHPAQRTPGWPSGHGSPPGAARHTVTVHLRRRASFQDVAFQCSSVPATSAIAAASQCACQCAPLQIPTASRSRSVHVLRTSIQLHSRRQTSWLSAPAVRHASASSAAAAARLMSTVRGCAYISGRTTASVTAGRATCRDDELL